MNYDRELLTVLREIRDEVTGLARTLQWYRVATYALGAAWFGLLLWMWLCD